MNGRAIRRCAVFALVAGVEPLAAQRIIWSEEILERRLEEALVIPVPTGGAYAVGRTAAGEVQVNDIVRGEVAWKISGEDFALQPDRQCVVIRERGTRAHLFALETGRLLESWDGEEALLAMREAGSEVPVSMAMAAGMLPVGKGEYENEALLTGERISARLTSGDVVVAERGSAEELVRVLALESGATICVVGDGAWSGPESMAEPGVTLRREGRVLPRRFDATLPSQLFGEPGPLTPGIDVVAGPWRVLERPELEGGPVREWSFWFRVEEDGRIRGRGHLTRVVGRDRTEAERRSWTGLSLQLRRWNAQGRATKEGGELEDAGVVEQEWFLQFALNGRSFEGRVASDGESRPGMQVRGISTAAEAIRPTILQDSP